MNDHPENAMNQLHPNHLYDQMKYGNAFRETLKKDVNIYYCMFLGLSSRPAGLPLEKPGKLLGQRRHRVNGAPMRYIDFV